MQVVYFLSLQNLWVIVLDGALLKMDIKDAQISK